MAATVKYESASTSDAQKQPTSTGLHADSYDPKSLSNFVPTTYDSSSAYLPPITFTGGEQSNQQGSSAMASVFIAQDQILGADPSLASNQAVMKLFAAQDQDITQASGFNYAAPQESPVPATTKAPPESTSPATTKAPPESTAPATTKAPPESTPPTTKTPPASTPPTTTKTPPESTPPATTKTPPESTPPSTAKTPPESTPPTTTKTPPESTPPATTKTPPESTSSVGANEGSGPDALRIGDQGNFGMTTWDSSNRSNEGFSQRYGVFEATMKLPPGGWPGFWMMSTAHASSADAPASEIDIMEATTAQTPNEYYATLHENSQTLNGGTSHITTFEDGTPLPQDLTTAYHTYGVIWPADSNSITYTLDGKAVSTVPKYDTTDSSPMMLILGQGDGDMTGGSPGTEGTLDVKSVNAYQYANELNDSNDPAGTTYSDTSLNTSLSGQSLVNTFHQDFTQPGLSTSNIESDDGPADGTPWTNHLWYQGNGNSAYLGQGPS